MRDLREMALIAALAGAGPATVRNMRHEPEPDLFGFEFVGTGDYRQRKRGKHKPRRHGQKLKANRQQISKRVRRKHRRAL